MVHAFGPHTFHTNNQKTWEYVNRFATFQPSTSTVKAFYQGRFFSFPINLMTLHQLWGVNTPEEARQLLESKREKIDSPTNLEDYYLSTIGRELYSIFIEGYTIKQWKTSPRNIDVSVARRLPIRLTFDDCYYHDKYIGIPQEGYTQMMKTMLRGIELRLATPFDHEMKSLAEKVIYTGRIDQYHNLRLGLLPYRCTEFHHETVLSNYFQGCAVVNYPDINVEFTRITEHKHLGKTDNHSSTIITYEYPSVWTGNETPLYPSVTKEDRELYQRYTSLPRENVVFGGRLGSYSYMDMNIVIEKAFELVEHELSNHIALQ